MGIHDTVGCRGMIETDGVTKFMFNDAIGFVFNVNTIVVILVVSAGHGFDSDSVWADGDFLIIRVVRAIGVDFSLFSGGNAENIIMTLFNS